MTIGISTNLSPVRIFDVAESLSGMFTAVELTASGVKTAGASSVPVGIFTGDNFDDTALVNTCGATYWKVGGTSICAGDLLSSDANGCAAKSASGQYVFAMAVQNASASSVAEVQIINGGFKG